ncbi:MAG: hypothetical protein J6D03_05580 [Clostridia bacterium]|nr:hypothetical protein [Clostridia bacterium]
MGKNEFIWFELLSWLENHFDEMFDEMMKVLNHKSKVTIEVDGKSKEYNLVGYASGWVIPMYSQKDKKLKAIVDAAYEMYDNEIYSLFISKFTEAEQKGYDDLGCSLEAIYTQDIEIGKIYWHTVAKFAATKGKKLPIRQVLD